MPVDLGIVPLLWERSRVLRAQACSLRGAAVLLRARAHCYLEQRRWAPESGRTLAYLISLHGEIAGAAADRLGFTRVHTCGLCGEVRTSGVTENRAVFSECANRECPLPVFRLPGEYSLADLNVSIEDTGDDPSRS